MKYILLFIMCLLLVGCNPVEPIIEPIISIRIEPEYSEIGLNESVELFCLDQLDRPVMASWSKRCGAGTLSTDVGETCIYTTPLRMEGIQIIWADYEGLRAEAKVNGIRR